MNYDPTQPLMIQNDSTVWLEVNHPQFSEIRTELSGFADLIKTPEHIHTYRMTPLSLWNAASAGIPSDRIIEFLKRNSKYGIPLQVRDHIEQMMKRYGLIRMELQGEQIQLTSPEPEALDEIYNYPSLQEYGLARDGRNTLRFDSHYRGKLKQELIRLGYPVEDLVGYNHGETLDIELKDVSSNGQPFALRDYQEYAVESFYREGSINGGNGVLVLPCGAGKTIIGIAAMVKLKCETLILTTNVTSVRQWKREILDKTDLSETQVGEYTGSSKAVRPVTIATYHILTHRKNKDAPFKHMNLFNERDWGLIIYDEVHLLPAPIFRVTAEIQATRRLGLTATLVREDRREEDVFSLVGPKRFEVPWKQLEQNGWIARVQCTEIRIPLSEAWYTQYLKADPRNKHRIAGENPQKLDIVKRLIRKHPTSQLLIIGQYLDQLQHIADEIGAPFISGQMKSEEREKYFAQFRTGEISILVVSKVANFAIDLPDAAVAIQVSGSFGSRQEEAQRLGRILRPKAMSNEAFFYTLVSRNTKEQEFSLNRQLFLVEQGYAYQLVDAEEMNFEPLYAK